MNQAIEQLSRRLNKLEEFSAMLFLAAIVIFVFAAAVMRSVGYPIIWSIEIAQLLFIWICMFGANQALRRDEHVGVDFLVRRFSKNTRLKIDLFLYLLISLALVLLIIFGTQLTLINPERTLGTVTLPYALVTAAVPFGSALMLFTVINKVFSFWRQLHSSKEPQESLL